MNFNSIFKYFRKLINGSYNVESSGKAMSFLAPKTSEDRLSKIFYKQEFNEKKIELALSICSHHKREVEALKVLLETHRLSQSDWTLDYQLIEMDSFYAHAEKRSQNRHEYKICCSVASPVILLSVAIELSSYLKDGSTHKEFNKNKKNSIVHWFTCLGDDAKISKETFDWALDASLLLYFHEVAHVLYGHCSYECQSNDEIRALELDADFYAGSMFGVLLSGLPEEDRKPKGVEALSTRLIRASFLLGVVMKATTKKSNKYHFPSTRIAIFNAGFAFALDQNKETPTFSDVDEGNKYWEERIEKEKTKIDDALRKSSLAYYAGTEISLNDDVREMETATTITIKYLKDGPLSQLKWR